jgi:hypothetical protein
MHRAQRTVPSGSSEPQRAQNICNTEEVLEEYHARRSETWSIRMSTGTPTKVSLPEDWLPRDVYF